MNDTVNELNTACINDAAVSYTHLDVYKRQEEDITKALIKDWKKYDVYGAVKC